MTCIIGYVCPKEKKVFIGGDSAASAGYNVSIISCPKVFRNGPFVIGSCGSIRMKQLLQYDFAPPEHPAESDNMRYMVSVVTPAIRKCLKEGGYTNIKENEETGGTFLIGYKGELYCVYSDFQVFKTVDNIIAIGCGQDHALGAMYALEHLYPKERICKTLEITTHLNSGVRPPFIIEEL